VGPRGRRYLRTLAASLELEAVLVMSRPAPMRARGRQLVVADRGRGGGGEALVVLAWRSSKKGDTATGGPARGRLAARRAPRAGALRGCTTTRPSTKRGGSALSARYAGTAGLRESTAGRGRSTIPGASRRRRRANPDGMRAPIVRCVVT
jgi:hypothetical protein